jgi:hypothetical protein
MPRNKSKKSVAQKFAYKPDPTLTELTRKTLEQEAAARQAEVNKRKTANKETDTTPVLPKYYLTNNIIDVDGHKLHQITAARDIPELGVQEGDLGGFIESEQNLSHRGTCWVFAGAVYEQAVISDGATVRGEGVQVHGQAKLDGGFTAYDNAQLYGNFRGTGCGKVAGRVDAKDYTMIKGSGFVTDGTIMRNRAVVSGNAHVSAGAVLAGNVEITGNYKAVGGTYTSGTVGRFTNDNATVERDTTFRDTDAR